MKKNLSKINILFPRDSIRRKIAKPFYNALNKMKKRGVGIISCEYLKIEEKDDAIIISGSIVSDNNIDSAEIFLDSQKIGEVDDWQANSDLKDRYFFTGELIATDITSSCKIGTKIADNAVISLRMKTENGLEYKFDTEWNSRFRNLPPDKNEDRKYENLLKKLSSGNKDIQEYIHRNKLENIYPFVMLLLNIYSDNTGCVLIYDHSLGGGANYYRNEMILKRVNSGEKILLISYNFSGNNYELHYLYKNRRTSFFPDKYDAAYRFLKLIPVKEVFINNLNSYNNHLSILQLAEHFRETNKAKLKLALHDYLPICPSYNLLNDKGEYCSLPELEICRECISKNKQEEIFRKNENIEFWREGWEEFLNICDEILCFSASSANLLKKAFPDIHRNKYKVIPHIVKDIKKIYADKTQGGKIRIGILGRIHHPKGSGIIKDMINIIEEKNISDVEIIVIGELADRHISSPFLKVTGEFKREELTGLVLKNEIDIFFIPSIWPETFSYTCEEVMKMGYPLAVFNLGAPAERAKHYAKGLVVSDIDAGTALNEIVDYIRQVGI